MCTCCWSCMTDAILLFRTVFAHTLKIFEICVSVEVFKAVCDKRPHVCLPSAVLCKQTNKSTVCKARLEMHRKQDHISAFNDLYRSHDLSCSATLVWFYMVRLVSMLMT